MNRRLFSKWAFWLLPWLVLRALLPAGFMLAADAGGLELVFCADAAPLAWSAGAAEASPADGGVHSEHHPGSRQIDPPCPFALATLAAIDVPHLAAAGMRFTDEAFAQLDPVLARPRPGHAPPIRGPPSLS